MTAVQELGFTGGEQDSELSEALLRWLEGDGCRLLPMRQNERSQICSLHLDRTDRDAWRLSWMAQLGALLPTAPDDLDARGDPPTGRPHRQLAVMFRLEPAEWNALSNELGAGWCVVDGRNVDRAEAVVMLPCSEQTTRAVRNLFPDARLIVIDDAAESCSHPSGPVQRVLAAGADVYSYHSVPAA